jgi:predicted outer membrane repeat protein
MKKFSCFVVFGFACLLLLGLFSPTQAAPLGTAFTYQGRLTDNGQPTNGTFDFIFTLYDAASGGSTVGSPVTQGDIPVSQGQFTALLDFGSGIFGSDARWLEIGVRPGNSGGGYTPLTPRQALTPTPYALYAPSAGTVGSVPWTAITGMPAGFADGIDNDTQYSAGAGLNLSDTAFSANFGGSGAASQVARSDHDHLGQTWTGSNNPLVITGSFNVTDSAVLMVSNSGSLSDGLRASSVGGTGVRGLSTGGASADNGVYGETNSTSTNEAGVKGASTSSAAGGYFTSSSGYGVYGSTSSASDFGGYFSNSTTTTSGGALYANGDAKQSLAGDGFVKAGLYVDCGNSTSLIVRSFNNVNTTPITVINGASVGRCTVDFGFNVSNRYLTATAFGNGVVRIVTYVNGSTDNRLDLFRLDQDGTGVNGGIMIVIY